MNTFSIKEALRFGWETFKKKPGLFIAVTLIIGVVSWITGFVAAMFGEDGAGGLMGTLLNVLVSTLVDLGAMALLLKAYDHLDDVTIADLWHPQQYLPYLAATVLTGLAVVIGLVLLIVPGIILGIMFMFVKFLVIDRNLGPIEAMKESIRITKGSRWQLLLFILAVVALNIVGATLLLVGLIVTIPVTGLAMVHVYRKLSHHASEVVPAPAPAAA